MSMEDWQGILRREEEARQAQLRAGNEQMYRDARLRADTRIRNYYQPFARTLKIEEQLESIRRTVWKKGSLSVVDELKYFSDVSLGFQGHGGTRVSGYSHKYAYELRERNFLLEISFSINHPKIGTNIQAVPRITENVYNSVDSFDIDTSKDGALQNAPHRFELALAKYCKAMTEKGYLSSSGLITK